MQNGDSKFSPRNFRFQVASQVYYFIGLFIERVRLRHDSEHLNEEKGQGIGLNIPKEDDLERARWIISEKIIEIS